MLNSIRVLSLSLLLLAFTSCSQSPADKLKTSLQTIISWTATAQMVGQAWLNGFVPDAYAEHALEMAATSLSEEFKTLQEQSLEGGTELLPPVLGQVQSLEPLIGQMRANIGKRDGSALSQLLGQLEGEEQKLKELAKSGGVQP